ncbi:hypothetical protein JCM3774_002064 [Rhodotorula dairenensis]
MESRSVRKTARTRAPPANPSLERSVGLRFVSNETPQALGPLPSFRERLSATDTWNSHLWSTYSAPSSAPTPSGAVRAASDAAASPTRSDSAAPAPYAPRRASTSSMEASSSSGTATSSRTRGGRKSQSPEVDRGEPMSAAVRRGLRQAEDEALQRAVASGAIKAESYTDGQVRAIKASAAAEFLRSQASAAIQEDATSTVGSKRSHIEMGGRAGQVASAVTTRRIDTRRRKRVVEADISEGDSGAGHEGRSQPVEVEVDLRKLLGV